MSLLGSAFGRALSGAGSAISSIATKYIDADLQRERDEALAALQTKQDESRAKLRLQTDAQARRDQAAFDDERAPVLRNREQDTAIARAGTEDQITIGRANNSVLQEARRRKDAEDAAAAEAAKIAAEKIGLKDADLQNLRRAKASGDAASAAEAQRNVTKAAADDPEYMKAATAVALSDPRVKAQVDQSKAAAAAHYASEANSNADRKGRELANKALEEVQGITDSMLKVVDDKTLTPEERAQRLGELQTRLDVLVPKKKGEGATQETVTEYGPDNKPLGSKVTVKGPAQNGGSESTESRERAVIDQALKAGKGAELLKHMESQGLSPREIVSKLGEQEYAKLKQPARQASAGQAVAPIDLIRSASSNELKRLASIEGHVKQQAAKDELARRAAERPEIDTSGVGFGGA